MLYVKSNYCILSICLIYKNKLLFYRLDLRLKNNIIIKYTYYYELYIECSNLIKILWNKWNRICIYDNENEKT